MIEIIFHLLSIEDSSRNPEKKELVSHYISYKSVIGEWIRNDDHLVHIAQIEDEYKVNLVFY